MAVSRSSLYQIIGATVLLLIAGILFFPASLLWNASIHHSAELLGHCDPAPTFEAKDQAGRLLGNAALRGQVWVADFIKLSDNQEGELFSSEFAELDQNFQRTNEVTLISFAKGLSNGLEDYAHRHEASSRWHFLAVSEEDGAALLEQWKARTAQCRGSLPLEKAFVLVDQAGAIRAIYDATAPEVVQKILLDLGTLLRDRTK